VTRPSESLIAQIEFPDRAVPALAAKGLRGDNSYNFRGRSAVHEQRLQFTLFPLCPSVPDATDSMHRLIQQIHKAQLLSYMKLRKVPLGLLFNFHEVKLIDGISRLVLAGANQR
jgi:hypothetical protein